MSGLVITEHAIKRWLQRVMQVIDEREADRPLPGVLKRLGVKRCVVAAAIRDEFQQIYDAGGACPMPYGCGHFSVKGASGFYAIITNETIMSITAYRVDPNRKQSRKKSRNRKYNRSSRSFAHNDGAS